MPKSYLPNITNYDGSQTCRTLQAQDLNWYSAFYTYLSDIVTGGTASSFFVAYTTGNVLFDYYAGALEGGSATATIKTKESFVCPTKASSAVLWADVSGTYTIDQLEHANLCYVRQKDATPYLYTDVDGYDHQIYLLDGYTVSFSGGGGDPRHYFFWCWNDAGTLTQVTDAAYLPGAAEAFDMWVPTSLNFLHVPYTAGLYQSFGFVPSAAGGSSPTPGSSFEIYKESFTVTATPTKYTGQDPIGTTDLTNFYGTQNVVFGFLNGIEVNVVLKDVATAAVTDDLIIDTASAGYPSVTNVYWNGTFRASSTMGDLVAADIIRIYLNKTP